MPKSLTATALLGILVSATALPSLASTEPAEPVINVEVREDLSRLGKDAFDLECDYDVYFYVGNGKAETKARANHTDNDFLVFDYYNTLRAIYKHTPNAQGTKVPHESNRLPKKTYLIHRNHKGTAYPYSIARHAPNAETGVVLYHTNSEGQPVRKDSTILVPGGLDTMHDIEVNRIVQRCPLDIQQLIRKK
ncbi:hypothetical protein [Parendozoicomonas haliclonae]|uniref:Uncharacterized protein n=1 Tax=Parendozoicomonas haliclonae TaxID=1960125 RepID=A0A1X7AP33_9GAMM|nr:hypothetical protein [Parendozoicomonas haliclonae]SMA50064.1 hypothetical protein EHSB41UT_03855 [Parendozoicomonas haliclonae]